MKSGLFVSMAAFVCSTLSMANLHSRDVPGITRIWRSSAAGGGMDVLAEGVRNSVGLAVQPQTGELWLADNGRDLQ